MKLRVLSVLLAFAATSFAQTPFNGVVAHRGNSAKFPQNTLPAFQSACDIGADWVETDVHFSKDGVLVICHDHTTGAVADRNLVIKESTYSELCELDMAAKFRQHAGLSLEQCPRQRICTLDEVLDLILRNKKARLSIQPKCDCVDEVMKHVCAKDALKWVGFNDGNAAWMSRVKELQPSVPVNYDRFAPEYDKDIAFAKAKGFETIAWHSSKMTPEVVAKIKAAGLIPCVWTVNNPEELKKFLDMGVERIYTDAPETLLAIKKEREAK